MHRGGYARKEAVMKWLKKMAEKQSRMETTPKETDLKERELARREQMKLNARKAAHHNTPVGHTEGGMAEANDKVRELREALLRGDAVHEKQQQAIVARIGHDIDKHEAAGLLKDLEKTWLTQREVIKSRLRELDPSL
jgi:hypothetical protein